MSRCALRVRALSSVAAGEAPPLRVLRSESTDALLNLASEEWLFRDAPPAQTLFLWRNDKSVIVGRNQNVWAEVHVPRAEQLGVQIVRRGSGGGSRLGRAPPSIRRRGGQDRVRERGSYRSRSGCQRR